MTVGQIAFGFDNDVRDAVLPLHRHPAKIGFVADLENHVVHRVQFRDKLADQRFLDRQQSSAAVEGMDGMFIHRSHRIDVVGGIHRAELPLHLLIHGAEQRHFDNHPFFRSRGHEIFEPGEITRIPLLQIEFVPTHGIPRLRTPRPRAEKLARSRSQGVALNVKRPFRLHIGPAEDPRVVQPIGSEGFQIPLAVKSPVHHRPVMLAGRNNDHRLAPPLKIVGILWMQGNRSAGLRPRAEGDQDQKGGEERMGFHEGSGWE